MRVGYSRRYKERYQIAKEQVVKGRVGTLTGGAARVFNSRSQALAMLKRNPHATPVVDALTYYVDLMNWLFEGRKARRDLRARPERRVEAGDRLRGAGRQLCRADL